MVLRSRNDSEISRRKVISESIGDNIIVSIISILIMERAHLAGWVNPEIERKPATGKYDHDSVPDETVQ